MNFKNIKLGKFLTIISLLAFHIWTAITWEEVTMEDTGRQVFQFIILFLWGSAATSFTIYLITKYWYTTINDLNK